MEAKQTVEQLGNEITELAGHIQAATFRWLCLVAEFDQREGWGTCGVKSTAEWVGLYCSISPVAAREYVRVARRLPELPLTREAFRRGELSYSKVRALTRLDDVEREAELLEIAQHATAAGVERAVRGYRWVVRANSAPAAYDERFLRLRHDDDGSVLVSGRLPREEGAVLMRAL